MSERVPISGIILFLFVLPLFSNPLETDFNYFGQPYLLFTNSSLLSTQTGNPVAVQFLYDTEEKLMEYKGAAVLTFRNNAFSLGYIRGEEPDNRVYSAYSFNYKGLNLGTSYAVSFGPSDPSLTVDIAAAVKIFDSRYVSIGANNILGTDTILNKFNRKASISVCGPFPHSSLVGYDCSYYMNFYEQKKGKPSHGGRLFVSGKTHGFTSVHYSLGLNLYSDRYDVLHEKIECGLGFLLRISEVGAGILSGLHYDISTGGKGFYGNFFFNPTLFYDRDPPLIGLDLYNGSEMAKKGLYLKISCNDREISSGIKNWTIVFSTVPSREGSIIKSFSGGNIPPSTIFWDRRDVSGNLYTDKSCFVRLIVTDNNNNVGSTPWKKVNFD